MFIDFKEVKEKVSLVDAAGFLGLHLNQESTQLRGACPACKKGGDRALVITPNTGFYCQAAKTGGDVIGLVAHIMQLGAKDAAAYLADCIADVPQELPTESGMLLATAKGFPQEVCKAVGIKFTKDKLDNLVIISWKKTVEVPIRGKDGKLLGTIYVDAAMLSPEWELP